MPRLRVFIFLVFFSTVITSECLADGHPLFKSDDTLELVLEVPMRTLLRSARKKPILDGQVHFVDTDGSNVAIDLTITTRGKSRLEHCSFPPLSITLNKEQTPSTLFASQRKLKIVTHCNNGSTYLRYLDQEFGIYKAYNHLSEHSFRVRMLNITYRDIEKKRRDDVRQAFFIESDREVANRLRMESVKSPTIKVQQLDPAQTSIYSLFQYMIANTDWSIKKGPRNEDCCHNGKVIAYPGAQDHWVVLAYDFDQAGIINTKYALPAKGLGIRNVRTRLYRGRCRHNDKLDGTITLFNDRRDKIETALVPQSLSARTRKSTLAYLADFYTTINDPAKLNKEIMSDCLSGS